MNTIPFGGINSRLALSIDAVDSLIRLADVDHDLVATLTTCRVTLAAISWERFRVRHEELSRRAVAARRHSQFVQRHQR